jgi:hypothetical protein
MKSPDQNRATVTANLLEELRQVSAALWNVPGGPASEQFSELLNKREAIITKLPEHAKLTDEQRRTLTAILSGDRYLMQQIANESAFVENRLNAVTLRKRAAHGYGRSQSAVLNRTA